MWVIDLFLIAICALFIFRGYSKGFINEWSGLLGIIVGVVVVRIYDNPIQEFLHACFGWRKTFALISGKLILLSVSYLLVVWLGRLITKLLKLVWLNGLNRLFGALTGAIKGVVFVSILWALYIHLVVPYFHIKETWFGQTVFFTVVQNATGFILNHSKASILYH